jgi:glutamate-1-semialdehyde aminotransferase/spore coat polysaccharide biosynthesis protein SpsF (cytidylyltransferase family)
MRVLAIIQARMGSTRLPNKVLADIAGKPMLWRVVERVRQSKTVEQIIVATTKKSNDDLIVRLCDEIGINYYRGSEEDVLDRYYQAAKIYSGEVIVRITADCPLIDPDVIDKLVQNFQKNDYDYISNTLRYTYPDGLDTEVFSFIGLEQAWREAKKPFAREHVTPYFRYSGKYRLYNVENEVNLSSYRWTVDEPADLELIRNIYNGLPDKEHFHMDDVLKLLKDKPELEMINANKISNEGFYRSLYAQGEMGPAPRLTLSQSKKWFARSQKVIPGCAQTFSKSYTQYVQGVSPIFLERGKGCRAWDVDGNEYIDYVQGLLPNILGYGCEEVNAAVTSQLADGHSFSLPHPLEVRLAERLTRLIPCAEMVRFGKNGSDATSGAIRAARAYTNRERIACCGYHGWQDWYIGVTTRNLGVPESVRNLTHTFPYNDLKALNNLFNEYPGEIAAVIMEPFNFVEPEQGYLQGVKDLAHRNGALVIFDEICTGFRFGLGGAQKRYGVIPDMACFGKAMANGFPLSCIVGSAVVMKIFEEIFFSFTFAGEVASMAASMKVIDILEETDALAQINEHGKILQNGFNAMAKQSGLADRLECIGNPSWALLKFRDTSGNESLFERSLFQQEAIKRKILLLTTHNVTAAHDDSAIEFTLEAYASIFKTLSDWLSEPNPSSFLEGPMIQPVFRVR